MYTTQETQEKAKFALEEVDSYGLAMLQCDVSTAVFEEYGSAGSGFQPKC